MARTRVALRLARREVRRHPGRHLLVLLLIFVPTLAAFATFSAVTTGVEVSAQRDDYAWGGATLVAATSGADQTDLAEQPPTTVDPLPDEVERRLPAGSTVERRWTSADWLVLARQRVDGLGPQLVGAEVHEVPSSSRLADRYVIDQGRLPDRDGEVFLTRELARSGNWQVGSPVRSARTGQELRVVGIGAAGDQVEIRSMVVAPRQPGAWGRPLRGAFGTSLDVGGDRWTDTQFERLAVVWTPEPLRPPVATDLALRWVDHDRTVDNRVTPLLTVAAAAMAALVAVVASAAFAIASRRQLRSIGLLTTAGADPATVRTALIAQGAVPGAVAGLLAVGVGMVIAQVLDARAVPEHLTHVAGAQTALSWWGAVVAVGVGTGAGALAAWHPSRVAARLPVLSALAGRRPVGPVSSSVPIGGLILWGAGAVAVIVGMRVGMAQGAGERFGPFAVLVGVLALALGGVGLAPAAIALVGRGASHTSGMGRLALRGVARNRAQSASAVAAVGMALALPVGLLTVRAGTDRDRFTEPVTSVVSATSVPQASTTVDDAGASVGLTGSLRSPDAAAATESVLDILGPDAVVVRTLPIVDQSGGWRRVVVIDEASSARVLRPWAADAVRRGDLVDLRGGAESGKVTLTVADDTATFAAVAPPTREGGEASFGEVDYVVGAEALAPVGRERPAHAIDVLRRKAASPRERAQLQRLGRQLQPNVGWSDVPTLAEVQEAMGDQVTAPVSADVGLDIRAMDQDRFLVREPDRGIDRDTAWLLVLAAGSTLVALLVLTIALSLRSVDGAADRAATLAAGATPAQIIRQRAIEGGVLALVGAVLALPLGWLTVIAVRFGEVRRTYGGEPGNAVLDRLVLPGWQVVPILLAPAVLVMLAWWLAPSAREALRRTPQDQLLPRW